MKDIQISRLTPVKIILAILTIFLILSNLAYAADTEHYSEETLISLDFDNKSLNQVLKEISWITGYSFVINREYAEIKVSGTLKNVPLHQGLKEIVGKRSHTITYEPNKTVSLSIYESSPPAPYIQNLASISSPNTFTTITAQPYNESNLQSSRIGMVQRETDLEPNQDYDIQAQNELDTEYSQEYDDSVSDYDSEPDTNYDDENDAYEEYDDQDQQVESSYDEEQDEETEDFREEESDYSDPYDDAMGTVRSNDYQDSDDYQEEY